MINEIQTQQQHPGQPSALFKLVIENTNYNWHHQFVTGEELRRLANLSSEGELFLAVPEPWNDQAIDNKDKVDLGRPDIEHFYMKRKLKLTINKKHFEWQREYITGKQIKHLGNIDIQDELFLKINDPGKDEFIPDDSRINLALPGVEHFYSKEVEKKIIIIVNGTPKKWDKKEISFKEVIIIAYGNYIDRPTMVYTVAYEDGPKQNPEGSMTRNATVFVKNKMIFHATATDKS